MRGSGARAKGAVLGESVARVSEKEHLFGAMSYGKMEPCTKGEK